MIVVLYFSDPYRLKKAESFVVYHYLHKYSTYSGPYKKAAAAVVGPWCIATWYLINQRRMIQAEKIENHKAARLDNISTKTQNKGRYHYSDQAKLAEIDVITKPQPPAFVPNYPQMPGDDND